jgi:hypothetical protein
LFTEHYLNITSRTRPSWFWDSNAVPSDYYLGWIPDCLIPFSASRGKGGAPFDIGANKNQGVWVDVTLPETLKDGVFTGSASVLIDGNIFKIIPLELMVYDFTLPHESHIHNSFTIGIQDLAKRHNQTEGSASLFEIETRYHQMAHRHRFNLGQNVSSISQMNAYHLKYLNGSMFSNDAGYDGPGKNIGNNTFMMFQWISEFGSTPANFNESLWWSGSDTWEQWFRDNAPVVERCHRIDPDEPFFAADTHAAYSSARQQCTWNSTNSDIGKSLPAQSSTHIIPNLKGYITYWLVSGECSSSRFTNIEDVQAERDAGNLWGIYNGFRPCMGAVTIDADAVEFRVIPWIIWKYNVDQYAYWRVNYWQDIDVFTQPVTYQRASANGDGTFFYPGRDFVFPAQDRGLDGPLSSIRMKNWRRGAQDFEYLWLAEQNGIDVSAIVDECVPKGLWEAELDKDISWTGTGRHFEKYRNRLAELLLATNVEQKVIFSDGTANNISIKINKLSDMVNLECSARVSGMYVIKIYSLTGRLAYSGIINLISGETKTVKMDKIKIPDLFVVSILSGSNKICRKLSVLR